MGCASPAATELGQGSKPSLALPKVSLLSLVASPQPWAQVDQLHHESRAELDPGLRLSWADPAVQLRNPSGAALGNAVNVWEELVTLCAVDLQVPNAFCMIRCVLHVLSKH